MKIIPYESKYIDQIRNNWNNDTPDKFHLRKDLMESQIVKSDDIAFDASFVVIENDSIVGAVIAKTWDHTGIPRYNEFGWITFIHVVEQHRRKGIGTDLLQQSVKALKDRGKKIINIGKDMNNLFCGVPVAMGRSPFFIANGFKQMDAEFDMHLAIDSNTTLELRSKTDYDIGLATTSDFPRIHDFFERCFPGRWQQEFKEYADGGNSGTEFVIIQKDEKVIAFCRINDAVNSPNMYNTNFASNFKRLFGVGPLGVDPDYRGYSLGYDVTAFAVNQAINSGASDIIIDWTSLVDFYKKLGFTVWSEYNTFQRQL